MLNLFKRKPIICYEVRITEIKNGIKNEDRRYFRKKEIAFNLFLKTEKLVFEKFPNAEIIKDNYNENNYNDINGNSQCYLLQKTTYSCIREKNILNNTTIIELFECIVI